MNFNQISSIEFPVYVLHTDEVEEQDGLLFCDTQIVDDKNVKGATIGLRRLRTPHKKLYPLKYMLEDFRSLIQHRGENYIDTRGKYFRYEKTTTASLKSIKIKKVEQKRVATIVWLEGVPFPYRVKRPPGERAKFAQVLMVNKRPSILWSFSEEEQKITWRKI